MNWVNATGTLTYDPPRKGFIKKKPHITVPKSPEHVEGVIVDVVGLIEKDIPFIDQITTHQMKQVTDKIRGVFGIGFKLDQVYNDKTTLNTFAHRVFNTIPKDGGRDVNWWCVLNLHDNFAEYYRWFMDKHWWEYNEQGDRMADGNVKYDLKPQNWGNHISVIRGEIPVENTDKWGWRNRKTVTFSYNPTPVRFYKEIEKREYWVFKVMSEELMEIRDFYKLPTRGFHITIGRREGV